MPYANTRDDERPTIEEVRAALDRIAASEAFRASPQLVAFLRYVVEATLRGGQDRIKGYTIAVEALGRGDDFDPQHDPIVRVEAMRLRRALQRYYANGGGDDAVQIVLPRGSYVPVFRRVVPPIAQRHRERAHNGRGPIAPTAWDDFLLFLTAYMEDDRSAAAHYAARIPADAYPLDVVARAPVTAYRGEGEAAEAFLDRLSASRPEPWKNAGSELAQRFPAEAIVSRIVRDLGQIDGVAGCMREAAATRARNWSTACCKVPACAVSALDASSTWVAERLVSSIASVTVAMLPASSRAPVAASCTLRPISCVEALCSSTDAAMVEVKRLTSPITLVIWRIASTACAVEPWIAPICPEISSVALAVWLASVFTSEATTAKPRPASPARAASIVALSASRLVCSAIARISLMTSPMRLAPLDSCPTS